MGTLDIGVTGLMAARRALDVTAHNVSNATTPGYSRQRVEVSNMPPQFLGGMFVGQGVRIVNVERIQSEFIDTQVRTHLSGFHDAKVRAEYAGRVDGLLADARTGLAPVINTFFGAANDVASDPTSSTSRTVLLAEAESLAQRFRSLHDTIEEQRRLLNSQIAENVEEINELSQTIADLNRDIVIGYGLSGGLGGPPNDLLDQRGEALNKLAAKIDIRVIEQSDRSVSVFIGSGQPIVLADGAKKLVAEPLSGDLRNYDVGFASTFPGSRPVSITGLLSGGELGGLLETRGQIFDHAQNGLGLIAVTLGLEFNRQNRLGLDLNGELGGDVFKVPPPEVGAYKHNVATGNPKVSFIPEAVQELTGSDYRLYYDSSTSTYRLIRNSDERTVAAGTSGVLEADGLRVDLDTITGSPANGDTWTIQPTRNAAATFAKIMVDGNHLAAATGGLAGRHNTGAAKIVGLSKDPLAFDARTTTPAAVVYDAAASVYRVFSPAYSAPTGPGRIEGFRITDPSVALGGSGRSIAFDYANDEFVIDGGAMTVARDESGTTTIQLDGWELKIRGRPHNGDTFDVTAWPASAVVEPQPAVTHVAGPDWTLALYGAPKAGDTFIVDLTQGREGDNRNMLALAGLREARLIGGSATYEDRYNTVLGDVGTRTRQAQVSREANRGLLEQAQAQREAISGVSLDEEAAHLIRFQQAYQASAQVIAVANGLFDTLLAAVNR